MTKSTKEKKKGNSVALVLDKLKNKNKHRQSTQATSTYHKVPEPSNDAEFCE